MTRQEEVAGIWPVMKAFSEGVTVQHWNPQISAWVDNIYPSFDCALKWRVKPVGKTLRPWRPEEVPVGALLRQKNTPSRQVVILQVSKSVSIAGAAVILSSPLMNERDHHYFLEDLFTYHGGHNGDRCEYSTDQGKTWKPCGVEE